MGRRWRSGLRSMPSVRRVADSLMGGLGRLLVSIFFREIELEGTGLIDPRTPTVLVANHLNGLVDGLLLMATLRRFPRFLGKSTLFRILPLWPFLKLAGVVPVYRAKDGVGTDRNASTFRTCRRLLQHGGMVALFPEGISHDEPELQPLKTGAARIALGASADDGVEGVVVQPVGIVYDDKARFRSVALVRMGEPFPVARWNDTYRADDHAAVRELTAAMAAGLQDLSPSYPSWSEARTLRQIAEVMARRPGTLTPRSVTLSDRDQLARELASLEATRPQSLGELRDADAQYRQDLAVLGLSDAQLAASYRGWRVGLLFVWSVYKILVAAPFALVGAVVHLVPYEIVKQVAKKPTNEGMKATVKLLGCFGAFSALYAGFGVALALNFGAWAGLVGAVGAPACGYVTVRFSERVKRVGGAVAGYRAVRRTGLAAVRAHREEVVVIGRRLLPSAAPLERSMPAAADT
jgi:glycerol-3-phosphate O-acyltransferase/dihydroxyacetone phosphate acyltransferase